MSIVGTRLTQTYAIDEGPPAETVVEIAPIEILIKTPSIVTAQQVLELMCAVDDQDPMLITLQRNGDMWTAKQLQLRGEFNSVVFTLLADGDILGMKQLTKDDIVSTGDQLSFDFDESEGMAKMCAKVSQRKPEFGSYSMQPIDELGIFGGLLTKPEIQRVITSESGRLLLMPEEQLEKVQAHFNVGTLSIKLFRITNNLRDITNAVVHIKAAVELAGKHHSSNQKLLLQMYMTCLDAIQQKYVISAQEADFQELLEIHENALELINRDHPVAMIICANLASSYMLHFDHSMDVVDIDRAIEKFDEAMSHPHATGPVLASLTMNLGNCYRQKYLVSKSPQDIEKSLEHNHRTISLTSETDPNRPMLMSNLAGSYVIRYKETRDLADFDMALGIRLEALEDVDEAHPFYPDIICNIGDSYLRKFENTNALEDIDESISFLIRGVNHTPEEDDLKPRRISDLGNLYIARAQLTKNADDVDKAIAHYRRSLTLTPEGHPHLDMRLGLLISALQLSYELLDDIKDIDEAIRLQTIRVADSEHKTRAVELFGLAHVLICRYEKMKRIADMKEAVIALQQALTLTPETDQNYASIVQQLRKSMYDVAEHTRDLEDIDAMIEFGETSLALAPDTDISSSSGMAGMSTAWFMRFQSTGDVADIDRAITNQRTVVQLSEHSSHRRYLGELLLGKYRLTKSAVDMEEAIVVLQNAFRMASTSDTQVVANLQKIANIYMGSYYRTGNKDSFNNTLTLLEEAAARSSDHVQSHDVVSSMATALVKRFESSGNPEDINNAIAILTSTLEGTPLDHPKRHVQLNRLGETLRVRFENTGNIDDLMKSLTMLREATESALTASDSDRATYLGDLGGTLLRLFLLNGDEAALEESIDLLRQAVDFSKEDSSHHMHLSHLGNSLLRRFEVKGKFADIDEAVSVQQAAVQATLDRHISLRINLLNLGNAYQTRSLARVSADDMKEAVMAYRKASRLLDNENGPIKPAILDNLSGALVNLYNFVKDPMLLQEAMQVLRESMAVTPQNHPYKPIQLNNLAIIHQSLYRLNQDLKDIEALIISLNKALQHPAATVHVRQAAIHNLTWAALTRFKHTDNLADLDSSILFSEIELKMIPSTHYSYTAVLTDLAGALEIRYHRVNNITDLNKSIELYQKAALHPAGIAGQRLVAARRWARSLKRMDDRSALDGYSLVIELMPTVAWLGETVSERHDKISMLSTVVNEAVAAAISWNRLDLAIQWLEEGRSIVWGQLTNFRTPVDKLDDIRPDLADELRSISKALDDMGSRMQKDGSRMTLDQKTNFQGEARTQRELAEKWEELLKAIRMLDGFKDFLRPAKASQLLAMTRPNGIVVVINVHETRCDALVLRPDFPDIIHIPLDDLTYDKVESLRRWQESALTDYGIRSRGSRSGRPSDAPDVSIPFEGILVKLWTLVVRPILTTLGIQPSHNPKRIWWCATGPLAFLPIHAAGIYTGNDAHFGSITSDYVVSSYTPTINAVLSMAQRDPPRNMDRLLVVTQPETPDMLPLPETAKEGQAIQKIVQSKGLSVDYLEGLKATVENVVEKMEGSNWVHLACHALQDSQNPTKSAFYLQDGSLELSTLIRKQLPKADFAFLSACETGAGDERVPDEAVHLASGVLQAGYRSVIATMWAIDDQYAPVVAESVYKGLLEASNPPNSANAAYALQNAAREVRERLGNSDVSFLTWVPFIHFGI